MRTNDAILYSINVEDVQTAAEEQIGRKLTKSQIALVEDKLGDYIDWYNAIQIAIEDSIKTGA